VPPAAELEALVDLINLGYLRGILNKLGEIERQDTAHAEFVRAARSGATIPVRRDEGNHPEGQQCPQ
jgi:hypothetical protein